MCIYVHIYMRVCMHIYMCIQIYIYTYICIYVHIYIYIHICIYVYVYIYKYIYVHICIEVYSYMYVYTHTHTHTHTHLYVYNKHGPNIALMPCSHSLYLSSALLSPSLSLYLFLSFSLFPPISSPFSPQYLLIFFKRQHSEAGVLPFFCSDRQQEFSVCELFQKIHILRHGRVNLKSELSCLIFFIEHLHSQGIEPNML